jgi:hypothetical protein
MNALRIPLIVAIVALAACQSFGIPTPQTFPERIAAAYVTTTGVRQTALTLLTAKRISPDDAKNVNESANHARAGIDIARSLEVVDPTAADNRLNASIAILEALNTYLGERK